MGYYRGQENGDLKHNYGTVNVIQGIVDGKYALCVDDTDTESNADGILYSIDERFRCFDSGIFMFGPALRQAIEERTGLSVKRVPTRALVWMISCSGGNLYIVDVNDEYLSRATRFTYMASIRHVHFDVDVKSFTKLYHSFFA